MSVFLSFSYQLLDPNLYGVYGSKPFDCKVITDSSVSPQAVFFPPSYFHSSAFPTLSIAATSPSFNYAIRSSDSLFSPFLNFIAKFRHRTVFPLLVTHWSFERLHEPYLKCQRSSYSHSRPLVTDLDTTCLQAAYSHLTANFPAALGDKEEVHSSLLPVSILLFASNWVLSIQPAPAFLLDAAPFTPLR